MIKSGVFKSGKTGVYYDVYEVEEKGQYRLDICRFGTDFHNHPEFIEFSLFKRRKTYTYGDQELYKEFTEIRDTLIQANVEVANINEWVDGVFVMRQVRKRDDKMYMHKELINGKYAGELYILDNAEIQLKLFMETDFGMDPLNLREYQVLEVMAGLEKVQSPYVPLSILTARYDLSWIHDREYYVIKDVATARGILQECIDSDEMVGFDYETTGVDFHLYSEEKMVGIVISPRRGYSYYFPFAHTEFENLPYDFVYEVEKAMQTIHQNSCFTQEDWWVKGVNKPGACGHNIKFEHRVSKKLGLNIPIRHDSFLLSKVINPKNMRGIHALKTLEHERSGLKFLEFEDIFLDKKNINFAELPEDVVRVYACPDADNCCAVFKWLWDKLPSYQRAVYELEAEVVEIKADQEYWGARIKNDKFIEDSENVTALRDLISDLIKAMARTEANINSPQFLEDLLYNRLKAPVMLRTKRGKPSTSGMVLKKLANLKLEEPLDIVKTDIRDSQGNLILSKKKLNETKFPIVLLLDKYREINKLVTGFYNRIVKGSIGEVTRGDNDEIISSQLRYFSWYDQYGAESGRQSSPMHQFPTPIKKTILADSEDHYLIDSDYKQVELRLIFSLAGEQVLIDLCSDPDNDIHRAIACLIQGKEMWEISAEDRKRDKSRNFGVVYLISGMGLAAQRYGAGASKEQIQECNELISDFYKYARRVAAFIKENRETILETGQISTLFNRTRYFPNVSDPDLPKDKKEAMVRQGNNMPVQGLAADLMKRAEANCNNYIKAKGWDKLVETPQGKFPLVRSILSAHDELLASAHKSIPVEEVLLMKKVCMEFTIKDFAPLYVGSSIIDNWAEGKADEYEVPHGLRDKLIKQYQETGVSITKDKDNIKEIILELSNHYRDEELIGYMEGLIAEHGAETEKVAPHVRHASLTHELIARFSQTEEHKSQYGKLQHYEHIEYSVSRYLEFRQTDEFKGLTNIPSIVKDFEEVEKVVEDNTAKYFEEITGLAEELYEYDDEGNIVYTSESGEGDEDAFFMFEDEQAFVHELSSGEKLRVWEMFDAVCIDTSDLLNPEINKLLAYIHPNTDPSGFFSIKLFHNGKLLDTGMRIERANFKEWEDFLNSMTGIQKAVPK